MQPWNEEACCAPESENVHYSPLKSTFKTLILAFTIQLNNVIPNFYLVYIFKCDLNKNRM